MNRKRNLLQNILLYTTVIVFSFICLFPFVVELSISFKYPSEWGDQNLIPKVWNFEAYSDLLGLSQKAVVPENVKKILDNPALTEEQRQKILDKFVNSADIFPFLRYMGNSLFFSGVSALVSLSFAIFGAYSVTRLRFIGKEPIKRGLLLVYMIGGVMLMIPLYQLATKLGLTDTLAGNTFALLAIYVLQTLPVSIYMLGNYFRTIPYSLEEAAYIDGATRMQTIFKVIIPLSMPMIVTVYIYCFIIGWNEYLFASIFLKDFKEMYTLPMGLRFLFESKNSVWDRIMAGSILTLLPVLMVYLLVSSRISSGLSEGGVKE